MAWFTSFFLKLKCTRNRGNNAPSLKLDLTRDGDLTKPGFTTPQTAIHTGVLVSSFTLQTLVLPVFKHINRSGDGFTDKPGSLLCIQYFYRWSSSWNIGLEKNVNMAAPRSTRQNVVDKAHAILTKNYNLWGKPRPQEHSQGLPRR